MDQLGDARGRQVTRLGNNLILGSRSNLSGIKGIVSSTWDSLDNIKVEMISRNIPFPKYNSFRVRSGSMSRKADSNAAAAAIPLGVGSEPRPPINTDALPGTSYRRAGAGAPKAPMHPPKNLWQNPEPKRSTLATVCSGLTCGLSNYIFGKPKTEGGRRRTHKRAHKKRKNNKRQSRKM